MAEPGEPLSKYDKHGRHPYVAYLQTRYPGYATWRDAAGVPVLTGSHVPDLAEVPLADWAEFGVRGALLNLGDAAATDGRLLEIAAGAESAESRQLVEIVVFVLAGDGSTEVTVGGRTTSVPWHPGTLFGIPLNATYRHRARAGGPARLLSFTDSPLIMDFFHNVEVVSNTTVEFPERAAALFDPAQGSRTVRWPGGKAGREVGFIADIAEEELAADVAQGAARTAMFGVAGSLMTVTVGELPAGTYTQPHNYGPGAQIYILAGEGRSVIEKRGKKGLQVEQIDWRAGSLLSPLSGALVQHFNLGAQPVRYLIVDRPRVLFPDASRFVPYAEQGPTVHAEFERELAARGLAVRMPAQPLTEAPAQGAPETPELGFTYEVFQAEERLPVLNGFFIADVADVERAPWERMGGKGGFINLAEQDIDDAYVLELAPGQSARPQRHMFEQVVLVLRGRGSTSVWNTPDRTVSFEWTAGSLFALPLNAHYQHFNGDGSEPALLLTVTSAPVVMNLFRNRDFVFANPYQFTDRFAGERDEFTRPGTFLEDVPGALWETNFLADINNVRTAEWNLPGRRMKHAYIALAANVMKVHVAEFPPGTYKAAHKHGAGAHILILDGEGYSLMWRPGETPKRYDWQVGSMFSPPANWYHQHFNTGATPATYMAFHRPSTIRNDHERGQIDFDEEDPRIRADWEAELARKGVQSQMPERVHDGASRVDTER